ncbi:hypothetical protein [Verrucomicrobium spinosum]|uniref:hypothetical protein n=1 Tax=Verrucomicrobium spinosum TaxID=2736 RepID=UPI00094676E4|nr:hypothetical protein [Verrucomicrobium spinosum]
MAPLRFKAQLLRQRLARYTLAAAAIVLSANFQLACGQSTASTSFWTGEANGNWNTLGNWNFGAANADATTLPQDQATSTNRKVLFTDEPGFVTTIRSITLARPSPWTPQQMPSLYAMASSLLI